MNTENPIPLPNDLTKHRFAWSHEFLARAEEQNWTNEEVLTGQLARNKLLHLKAIGWVVFGFILLFSLIFCAGLLVWVAHYVTPTSMHWLTDEQLSKIQSVIFSGALGVLVTAGANKFVLN